MTFTGKLACSGPYTSTLTTKVITATRTRTGTRLPKWKKIIEDGGNATTPLTAVWDTFEGSRGYARVKHYSPGCANWQDMEVITRGGSFFERNGAADWNPSDPTMSTSNADNRAKARFYKKLRQDAVAFSGMTFMGELRETLHMLRRPASALYSNANGYLDSLNKAKRSNPRHWTKAISGLWLEHAFGWLPLLNDMKDAALAWDRLVTPKRRKYISVGAEDEADTTSAILSSYSGVQAMPQGQSMCYVERQCRRKEKTIVRYRGAITAQAEATTWDNWALFGFTPSEFIPTAWNLLPWSFLADYVTNIGDVLESVVTDTKSVAWANRTVVQTVETLLTGKLRHDLHVANNSGGGIHSHSTSGSPGYLLHQRKTVNRASVPGVGLPSLQLDLGLSMKQIFNIAALFGSAQSLHPQNPRVRIPR